MSASGDLYQFLYFFHISCKEKRVRDLQVSLWFVVDQQKSADILSPYSVEPPLLRNKKKHVPLRYCRISVQQPPCFSLLLQHTCTCQLCWLAPFEMLNFTNCSCSHVFVYTCTCIRDSLSHSKPSPSHLPSLLLTVNNCDVT